MKRFWIFLFGCFSSTLFGAQMADPKPEEPQGSDQSILCNILFPNQSVEPLRLSIEPNTTLQKIKETIYNHDPAHLPPPAFQLIWYFPPESKHERKELQQFKPFKAIKDSKDNEGAHVLEVIAGNSPVKTILLGIGKPNRSIYILINWFSTIDQVKQKITQGADGPYSGVTLSALSKIYYLGDDQKTPIDLTPQNYQTYLDAYLKIDAYLKSQNQAQDNNSLTLHVKVRTIPVVIPDELKTEFGLNKNLSNVYTMFCQEKTGGKIKEQIVNDLGIKNESKITSIITNYTLRDQEKCGGMVVWMEEASYARSNPSEEVKLQLYRNISLHNNNDNDDKKYENEEDDAIVVGKKETLGGMHNVRMRGNNNSRSDVTRDSVLRKTRNTNLVNGIDDFFSANDHIWDENENDEVEDEHEEDIDDHDDELESDNEDDEVEEEDEEQNEQKAPEETKGNTPGGPQPSKVEQTLDSRPNPNPNPDHKKKLNSSYNPNPSSTLDSSNNNSSSFNPRHLLFVIPVVAVGSLVGLWLKQARKGHKQRARAMR